MTIRRNVLGGLLVAAAFIACPSRLSAAACTWDGSANDWSSAAHWSCAQVPDSGDTATISSGTVHLTANQAAGGLSFSGGSIDGTGDLALTGTSSWSGGTMGGAGTTTVAAGGTLTITNGVTLSRVLTNNGTSNWVSGQTGFNNGTFNNNAAFNAQPDNALGNFGGTNAFNNNASGTFTRNTGTGNLDIGIPFNNAGTATVSTGALRVIGGGSSTGTFNVPSGTTLSFHNSYDVTAGTLTVGGTLALFGGTINMTPATYTATGLTNLAGAIYNLNKNSSTSNWTFASGTLGGSGLITVSSGKTFDWSGGTMGGAGTTTVAAGGTLTITNGVTLSRVLTNNGTSNWVSGQTGFNNGTFNNNAAFNAQPDNALGNFGGTNAFNNNASGTFTRNTGTGNLDIGIPFNNAGTATVSTGALRVIGGGSSTGTFNVPSGTILSFHNNYDVTAGTLTVGGTLALFGGTINMTPATYTATGLTNLAGAIYNLNKNSSTSNWTFASGTLGGSGLITVSSGKTFDWSGGTMGGAGTTTVAAGGTLTITNGVTLSRVLTNNGTSNWVSGQTGFNNGTFNNNAAFNAQPDNALGNFGGTNAFNNNASGTFTRNTGTGNLDIGIPFNNAGTATVSTGALRVIGGGSSTGTFNVPSGTTLSFHNSYDVTAGTLTVGGTLALFGGTINMTPATYTATGLTNLAGAIYNLNKNSSTSNWTFASGTLGGSGLITVSSGKTFDWSGGTMGGAGTTTVAAGGTLTITNGVTLSRVLTNNGTSNWVSGQTGFNNGTFNNNAAFNAQPDNALGNFGGTNAFNNNASGTFTRNTGTGNLDIGIPFNNAGTATVSTGALRVIGGGSSTGTFNVPSGTTLSFHNNYDVTAGTLTVGGTLALFGGTINMTPATYTATGLTNLAGAIYNLNKNSSTSNWTFASGTLGGSGLITVSSGKTFDWSGGTMGGAGTTTVAAGGTLTITNGVTLSRVLTNNGTSNWVSGQTGFNNGTFNNNAAFNAQPDNALGNFGGTNAFNNNASGTFTRNTGTGNLDIGIPFNNAGTATVSTGALRVIGGGSSTGTFNVPSGTTLSFHNSYDVTAGTLTVGGTLALFGGTINMTPATYTATGLTNLAGAIYNLNKNSSTSNWTFASGTLGGSGLITVSSGKTFDWSGGTMGGAGTTTVAAGGTLTITNGVTLSRVLTNNGTSNWVSGQTGFNNGTFNNNAAFNAQPDNALGNFGGTNAFNNNASGTFTRNTGTGNLDIGIPFNNAGTVNASSGTLRFLAVFTQTAGLTTLNGGDVAANSGLNIQGGTLKGAGTITGGVSNGGTVAPGLSPGILNVVGNYSQTAAGTLAIELNGTTLGTQYDQLNVTGTIALAGTLAVTPGFAPAEGDTFTILNNDVSDVISGVFSGLAETAVIVSGSSTFRITYLGGSGNDVVLRAGPAVAAVAILVDPASGAGSNGNSVFEPGETVTIKPSWQNVGTLAVPFSGTAEDFTGPGVGYSIPDNAAGYGTIGAGATADCGSNCYSLFVTDPATRPATHWDATFAETPNTSDPAKVWTLHLGDSFTDVPREQIFYRRIETLVHTAITSGCTPVKYCPNDPVTRSQMAIFIAKGIAGGGPNVPVSGSFDGKPYNCVNGGSSIFPDVAPIDNFCKHVHYMAVQNVTVGCGGGLYCPNESISRSDMAVFMAKALVAPDGGPGVPLTYGPDPDTALSYSCAPGSPSLHFTDVFPSDNYCKHVHYLWARGIISGCSDTTYCPADGVTRDVMSKFLGNAFHLTLYAP